MDSEFLMDDVNWRIVGELQDNARVTYTDLGRKVGLTAPAVAERIRRMEDAGIITGYHAEVDPERLGFGVTAVIRIATTSDDACSTLERRVKQIVGIVDCRRITGEDCYTMRVAVRGIRELESLIDSLQAYGRTTTSLVLSSPVTHRTLQPQASHDRRLRLATRDAQEAAG